MYEKQFWWTLYDEEKEKKRKIIINGSEVACVSGSQPLYIDSRFL